MAQADTVDVAIGPLRSSVQTAAPGEPGMPQFSIPPALLPFPAGGAAGPHPLLQGRSVSIEQLRPYEVQDMQQLLQLLAEHRPSKKLPTLYVYSESLSSKDRPGLLNLRGDWRSTYIKVRETQPASQPGTAAAGMAA